MLKAAGARSLCGGLLLFSMTLPAEPPPARAPEASPPMKAPVAAAPVALSADIPLQALAQALENFAQQTVLQYGSADGIVGDQQARGAPAGLTADEAAVSPRHSS